ncbi:hypothetical protein [Anatilimnocola floriformis]|uniref:hypothetical protein n=1 Tax=Anatilimnocola floriformis TaxID=2948575 RepID=UPI0020C245E0|nr:hypothetical protein [Anatilimnocola floriformis]
MLLLSPEMIAGLVVLVVLLFLVVAIVVAVQLGRAKAKIWAGNASLRKGNLAEAVVAYKAAAAITVGTNDAFKIWPGQQESFDQAMVGMTTAYQQAGLAINLAPLLQLHANVVQMSKRDGSGTMPGSPEEIARLKQQGVGFLSRLPNLPAGARPKTA